MHREILRHLQEDRRAIATTIVDYYGLPETWPSRAHNISNASPRARAESVQQAIAHSGEFVHFVRVQLATVGIMARLGLRLCTYGVHEPLHVRYDVRKSQREVVVLTYICAKVI